MLASTSAPPPREPLAATKQELCQQPGVVMAVDPFVVITGEVAICVGKRLGGVKLWSEVLQMSIGSVWDPLLPPWR